MRAQTADNRETLDAWPEEAAPLWVPDDPGRGGHVTLAEPEPGPQPRPGWVCAMLVRPNGTAFVPVVQLGQEGGGALPLNPRHGLHLAIGRNVGSHVLLGRLLIGDGEHRVFVVEIDATGDEVRVTTCDHESGTRRAGSFTVPPR